MANDRHERRTTRIRSTAISFDSTFSEQIGHEPLDHPALLQDSPASVVVHLEPRPVEIEGLDVYRSPGLQRDGDPGARRRSVPCRPPGEGPGLDLLSTDAPSVVKYLADAPSMVDYLWEEARALLLPCPDDDHESWNWSCTRFHGTRVAVEVRVDDVVAPGGPAMPHQYSPEDLNRVEVLPDLRQVRLYTRPCVTHLNRTGSVPPIWPLAWSPRTKGDGGSLE